MKPQVSICIPVFNSEDYLGLCIESCLKQSASDFEIIVADDCSTDRTFEVATSYSDGRIRVVRNDKNLGAVENWNFVVSLSKGVYIQLLCADDYLYPRCIERKAGILRDARFASVQLVCARRDVVDVNGRKILTPSGFGGRTRMITGADALRESLRGGTNLIGEPSAVLFRRSAIRKVSGFRSLYRYLPDWDCWTRILEYGDMYYLAESLSAFRISPASGSVAMARRQSAEGRAFIFAAAERWKSVSRTDVFVGCIRNRLLAIARRLLYLMLSLKKSSRGARGLAGRRVKNRARGEKATSVMP